jgi:hypothetical protein
MKKKEIAAYLLEELAAYCALRALQTKGAEWTRAQQAFENVDVPRSSSDGFVLAPVTPDPW